MVDSFLMNFTRYLCLLKATLLLGGNYNVYSKSCLGQQQKEAKITNENVHQNLHGDGYLQVTPVSNLDLILHGGGGGESTPPTYPIFQNALNNPY
jgi:hypothetical protein